MQCWKRETDLPSIIELISGGKFQLPRNSSVSNFLTTKCADSNEYYVEINGLIKMVGFEHAQLEIIGRINQQGMERWKKCIIKVVHFA